MSGSTKSSLPNSPQIRINFEGYSEETVILYAYIYMDEYIAYIDFVTQAVANTFSIRHIKIYGSYFGLHILVLSVYDAEWELTVLSAAYIVVQYYGSSLSARLSTFLYYRFRYLTRSFAVI